jgi:hypothetical protein
MRAFAGICQHDQYAKIHGSPHRYLPEICFYGGSLPVLPASGWALTDDPAGSLACESGWMRKGVEVRLGPGDRERLEAVIGSGKVRRAKQLLESIH